MKLAAVGVALLPLAWSCSYVELPYSSSNGTVYMIGRTMEFGNSESISYEMQTVPAKVSGGRYGYLGAMTVIGAPPIASKAPADGMNELGLTVSALELDQSVYEQPEAGFPSINVEDVVGNILANCATVEEAAKYLESVKVVAGSLAELLKLGLHWAIHDAAGNSVVVEYLEGKRVVYDNAPRVMTNDPDLHWHWRNLNTYTNLSPKFPAQNNFMQLDTAVGKVPRTQGHGWNLFGLPGDSSPPSRFARLFYLRGYALEEQKLQDWSDAVVLGTALLNNVFIPYGVVARNPEKTGDRPEWTPYGVLKSPTERKVMFRAYRNSQWRLIDLNHINWEVVQTWPLEDGTLGIEDITAKPSYVQVSEEMI